MHHDHAIVEGRITRLLRERIEPAIHRDPRPLTVTAWSAPGEPVPFAEAIRQPFAPVPIGWRWGRAWSTVWFHVTGELPAEWDPLPPGARAEILIDFGYNRSRSGFQAEALAYRPDGTPIKAISPLNSWVPWRRADGPVDVFLEAAANPDVAGEYDFAPTPYGQWETSPETPLYTVQQVAVALLDETVWELRQDVWTLLGLMAQLPSGGTRHHDILRALEDAADALDPADVSRTAGAARARLADALARPATASAHRIVATGHAHIDSAWLWPIRETVRKCARTFTNAMALMDNDPDFVFSCSSAQQYRWMKEHAPLVFERMRRHIAEGRFTPVGGMWVESDTNMPSGEALARQFVAGKRFFLEEFGVECEEAWLPDSFGYSAALPQIVRLAGARWFLTQKMSWNQTNRMPHHTFWWEGIDGTRVFTHLPPVDTYISELSGAELAHAERNFAEKGRATVSLVPFGWGDGGGGPTREMLAAAARTADLEGSPRVTVGTARRFFEDAEAEYPDAPVWSGEMYLELHRGVFTSQRRTKTGNRRNESLLREAELWATTAALRAGMPYPAAEFQEHWHTVLLLQFHDILPGSSIAWVHREAERRHSEVTAALEAIIERSLDALSDEQGTPLIANASPLPRTGVAALGIGAGETHDDVRLDDAPGGTVIDNGIVRATIDRDGRITSLIALADGRDAIAPGQPAGTLRLHRDLPNLWDAWDLDPHYRRTVTELVSAEQRSVHADADGAARVTTVRRVGASRIELAVVLRPGADAVELDLRVDWHEHESVLKLAVPIDVHAPTVAAETQFGHVRRATHVNTSWDWARFEACQHRWVHLDEPGYGVAIANDSTYGYDVDRQPREDGGSTTTVRFTLLRGPRFPDPDSDQGEHRMRFLVRPGSGIADAVALGYDLATATRSITRRSPIAPLVTSSHPSVVVDTVKLAEDGSGDLVVRCYESWGGRTLATIAFDGVCAGVQSTDLLERVVADAPTSASASIQVSMRPFQIRTLRFRRPAAR